METFIVTESTGDIKRISRNRLKDSWLKVMMGMVLYTVLSEVVPQAFASITPKSLMFTVEKSVSVSYLSSLYTFFTSGALLAGVYSFMLMFFRNRDPNPGYIFNGFGYYFKSLGLMIMIGFFTFLWSLLFVIPGIIAIIRYSQAFYILADHPSKGIGQCVNESKVLMTNNKMKYFMLHLSFIGWMILLFLGQIVLIQIDINPVIISLLSFIPTAALSAYVYTARTAFYELASGSLRAKPREHESFREIAE